ncbi:uncharacterized protein si:dkey-27h10.2 [Syngnathoides biaculeatus]|uniref:uncharacterized protein si:dkey-27h10.2 n=1 Tax=Syngnathoides biaculeatus TaxID=300417 RepID=UPI002ADE61CB|nr:uncharacterized protein si:dkey-27h10.2 [Syngnathoides biaculeatus]
MRTFKTSFVTLGVALVSFVASQTSQGPATDSRPLDFTEDFYPENMSGTMSYATTRVTEARWTHPEGTKSEGTTLETTPAPLTTSYIYVYTKMKENQKDKSPTTAKANPAKSNDSIGIIIAVLIIVVAIGIGIACYISRKRGRRYSVDFSTRADEADIPLSTVLANDSAPQNGLQTFESGDVRSKEEEKEEASKNAEEDETKAEAAAESAAPPSDDLEDKVENAEPAKLDQPDQQIAEGTAEESPKNENNSNNAGMAERKD